MKFKELVSISGLSGLYQLVATKSDGAIVRSIDDNITKFVAARARSVTALDGIEVFTTSDNMRLFDVFLAMKGNAADAGEFDLAKADNNAIKAHLAKLFPQYDADRVYISDMKKMIKWFSIVDAKGLLVVEEEVTAVSEKEATAVIEEAPSTISETPKSKKPKAEKVVDTDTTAKPKKNAKKKDAETAAE